MSETDEKKLTIEPVAPVKKSDGRGKSSAENLKKARAAREKRTIERMQQQIEEKKKKYASKRGDSAKEEEEKDAETELPNEVVAPLEEDCVSEEEGDEVEVPLEELKLVRAVPKSNPRRAAPKRAPRKKASEPEEEPSSEPEVETKTPRKRAPSRAEKQVTRADEIRELIDTIRAEERKKPRAAPKKPRAKKAAPAAVEMTAVSEQPKKPKYSVIRV
jgi:hypothetical protein